MTALSKCIFRVHHGAANGRTVDEKPLPVMVRGSPPVTLPAEWLMAVMVGCISYMYVVPSGDSCHRHSSVVPQRVEVAERVGIPGLSIPGMEGSKGSLAWGMLCSAHSRATLQARPGARPGLCRTLTQRSTAAAEASEIRQSSQQGHGGSLQG